MSTAILRFFNLMLVALLAGTSFGIWMGLDPMHYTAATYLEQQQNLVHSLNTLMVSMVIAATVLTFASAYQARQNRVVCFTLLIAAASLASCIFISRFGNLPIQQSMMQWSSTSLPDNWVSLRDKWWSFHILRTIAELIALTLIAWTYVANLTNNK